MAFDIVLHQERQKIISYGRTKWPEEKNITKLYEMATKELGVEVKILDTVTANHLPTPEESAKENPNSKLTIICPKCGEKSYVLHPICRGCKDSEDGKYKTMFLCYKCKYKEKSEKWLAQWMKELGIELPDGMKRHLGIQTVTNEGLK